MHKAGLLVWLSTAWYCL